MISNLDSQQAVAASYIDSRNFVHRLHSASRRVGVGPRQYELLVTVSQWKTTNGPTVRNVAEALRIRHNTTVELIDRSVERGAVERIRDNADRRKVFLRLTPEGQRLLEIVAEAASNQEPSSAGRPATDSAKGAAA